MIDGVMFVDIPESCDKCVFRGLNEFRCGQDVILEGVDTATERAGRCPIHRFDFDFCMVWAERFIDAMEKPKQVTKTRKSKRKLKRK